MKVIMVMGDAAVGHPDGTFSILRAGITQVNVPRNQPASFRGALAIRISGTPSEKGRRKFQLVCVNEDGGSVAPDIGGEFDIPDKGGSANIVLNIQMVFPSLGRYDFRVSVDGTERDTWTIEAKEATTKQKR